MVFGLALGTALLIAIAPFITQWALWRSFSLTDQSKFSLIFRSPDAQQKLEKMIRECTQCNSHVATRISIILLKRHRRPKRYGS